ncbi:hypothetical protein FQR65_LT09753 [Abscondita terminalis]|nr:hypothetical protein FQR65_LT09753 [Abscondita terminalis]
MSLCFIFLAFLCFAVENVENKSVDGQLTSIRSDVIVTKGFNTKPPYYIPPTNVEQENESPGQPGWMKRQLMRFGNMFGTIGNKLGGFTGKVTNALDKLCQVIKTIIPVVAAVCHVGQFQFCGSVVDAPGELASALAPNNIDLSIQD